jgi:hypothetical protein
VHGLEAEYYDKINFVYLDIDDNENDSFKSTLGFRYQPQIFLVDSNGNILNQWIGPITRTDLVEAFETFLD